MVIRYLAERFPAQKFAPLVLVIVAAAAVASRAGGASAATVPLAAGLVFQFRVWDDLEDRPHDRVKHPERVLSSATSLRSIRALAAAAFGLNLAIIVRTAPPANVVVFLALNGALSVWYRLLRSRFPDPLFGSIVVLAKYPVFVYLAAVAASRTRLAAAMTLVYLLVCIYEVAHDARLRGRALRLLDAGRDQLRIRS